MSVCDLLRECEQSGVSVYLVNGSIKASGTREAVSKYAPLLKTHKAEIERHLSSPIELNALFRFDLVKQEIAAGHSEAEMRRIHNMAYGFMRDDHLPLGEALQIAAQIVIHCPAAECEAAYMDVMNLWSKDNE